MHRNYGSRLLIFTTLVIILSTQIYFTTCQPIDTPNVIRHLMNEHSYITTNREIDTMSARTTAVSTTLGYCDFQPYCTPELIGQRFPYKYNCSLYIYCNEEGGEEMRSCPPNQHFSPSEQRCTDPDIAQCPDCSEPEIYCPSQPLCTSLTIFETLPYVEDCTKYIYCHANGDGELRSCPPDEHYSPLELLCMDPYLAQCPDCIVSTTTAYCPVQQHCTLAIAFSLLPYYADCTKYIYCLEDGTDQLSLCPTGEHFSSIELWCMDPKLAQCPECIETTTEYTTKATTIPYCPEQQKCTPEIPFILLPYVANCTTYIYCEADGSETLLHCPEPEHFSPTELECMNPEQAGCSKCPGSTTEITTPGSTTPHCPEQLECTLELAFTTIPYVADCTKYFYCTPDGSALLVDCLIMQHYSPTMYTCMEPELAGCPICLGSTTEPITTTTKSTTESTINTTESTTETTTSGSTTESTTSNTETSTDSTTEITSSTDIITESTTIGSTTPFCPGQSQCTPELIYGTIPYIADCSKYIYCAPDGSEVLVDCPVGLHFSPTEGFCMDPALAGCPKC